MDSNTPVEEVDDCVCEKETTKALLVVMPSGIKVWVPKSVISTEESEVLGEGDHGKLVAARWFCEKEGLG